jgi:hypothetical protein
MSGVFTSKAVASRMPATRDYRIDFWRGVALVMIFLNHIPGNIFAPLTSRNFGVSDAAELFVLLAGVAAGIAYDPRKPTPVFPHIIFKTFARAWKLYASHIVTCIVCVGALVACAYIFEEPFWLETHGLKSFFDSPELGMLGLAALGYQPAYLNILPMYIMFMLALPLIVLTARYSLLLLFCLSAALYFSAHAWGLVFHTYPDQGTWFFNPIAWQFLFVIGYCSSVIARSDTGIPYHPWLFFASVAYLLFCLIIVRFALWPANDLLPLPRMLWQFEKQSIDLPRILHVLALVYVVTQLPIHRRMRDIGRDNILVQFGRNSLAVFCLGSVLSMLGQVLRQETNGSVVGDIAIVGSGLVILYIAVQVIEWKQDVLSQPKPKPIASPESAALLREQQR